MYLLILAVAIQLHTVFNHVCVAGPPFPNGMITVVDLCLVDFALSWNPFSSNPVCGSVSYDVMILPSDGVMMMRITDTSYNFTRVLPDTAYTVTVTGINDDGMGLQSMMIINPRNRTSVLPGKLLLFISIIDKYYMPESVFVSI